MRKAKQVSIPMDDLFALETAAGIVCDWKDTPLNERDKTAEEIIDLLARNGFLRAALERVEKITNKIDNIFEEE